MKLILDKHDGSESEPKILLLLQNDQIQVLSLDEPMIMSTKELKYIHYLLRVEDETSRLLSSMILANITRRILDNDLYYFGSYVPKYINFREQEVKLKKGEAVIENVLTQRHITMNLDGRKLVMCY